MGDTRDTGWPGASFLAHLTGRQRAELLSRGGLRHYERGDTLMDEGAAGREVLVVLSGIVKISTISVGGHESVLAFRSRGDLIGEMAFVSGSPRSARVVAATPLDARVLSEQAFAAYLDHSPAVGCKVAAAVVRKLRAANRRRAEFTACSAKARAAAVLSETALALGSPVSGGLSIGPEITQADLASLASVSLSTFEKALHALERDGLVRRHRRALIVTDSAALRRRRGNCGNPQFEGSPA